jgi:hypothetical protein
MKPFVLLLRIIVSSVTFHLFCCANIQLAVQDLFGRDFTRWMDENATREMWRYIRNGTGLLRISGEELSLSCTADVPIKWIWTEEVQNTLIKFRMLPKLWYIVPCNQFPFGFSC